MIHEIRGCECMKGLVVLCSCLMFAGVWQGSTHKSEHQGSWAAFSVNLPLVFLKQLWILKRLFLQNQYLKKELNSTESQTLIPRECKHGITKMSSGTFLQIGHGRVLRSQPWMPSVAITSAAWRAIFKGSPSGDSPAQQTLTVWTYPLWLRKPDALE